MKILYRNFIRLLSIGAFDAQDTVEPMSEYKWDKLLAMAARCDVQAFIGTGIIRYDKKVKDIVPQGIYQKAKEYGVVNGRVCPETADKPKYSSHKQIKKFSNFYLNRKYNQIVFAEVHSIDTSVDSLVFLDKLISNINTLMNTGLDLIQLFDLGYYLRENGDKIDFIKIESWIKSLKLNKISNLVGCYLVFFFHFVDAELPFLKSVNKKNEKTVLKTLEATLASPARAAENENETDRQRINPIGKPNAHPMKYFSYFPLEASSRLVSNVIKSLSNIDE